MVEEPGEERLHHALGALGLAARGRGEVDVLEHEPAQAQEGRADLGRLADLVALGARVDDVGDQRREALGGGRAERRHLVGAGRSRVGDHPRAQRVLDVVVDVGDPVHQAHDLALERGGRPGPGVVEDAVAHRVGEVEPLPGALQHLDDPQALDVVLEAAAVALAQDRRRAPPRRRGRRARGRGRGPSRSPRPGPR